jgi:2'-5' RNA ligase
VPIAPIAGQYSFGCVSLHNNGSCGRPCKLKDVILHSIWLTLDPVSQRAVAAVIASIADRFGSPSFEPHITLLGDLGSPIDKSINLVGQIFANILTTRLDVSGPKCGDTFFTSIVLDAPLPGPLPIAYATLAKTLTPDRHQPFHPHVSLAYGLSDSDARTALISEQIKGASLDYLTVSGVAVVRSSKTTPIDEWATVSKFDLV